MQVRTNCHTPKSKKKKKKKKVKRRKRLVTWNFIKMWFKPFPKAMIELMKNVLNIGGIKTEEVWSHI